MPQPEHRQTLQSACPCPKSLSGAPQVFNLLLNLPSLHQSKSCVLPFPAVGVLEVVSKYLMKAGKSQSSKRSTPWKVSPITAQPGLCSQSPGCVSDGFERGMFGFQKAREREVLQRKLFQQSPHAYVSLGPSEREGAWSGLVAVIKCTEACSSEIVPWKHFPLQFMGRT